TPLRVRYRRSFSASAVDQHVALLVLLPAAAGAGIVATHTGAAAHGRRDRDSRALGHGWGCRAIGLLRRDVAERLSLGVLRHDRPRRRATLDLARGTCLELDAEQPLGEFLVHLVDEGLEQRESLLLVLDQRVPLPIGAQPDPALEMIELV